MKMAKGEGVGGGGGGRHLARPALAAGCRMDLLAELLNHDLLRLLVVEVRQEHQRLSHRLVQRHHLTSPHANHQPSSSGHSRRTMEAGAVRHSNRNIQQEQRAR